MCTRYIIALTKSKKHNLLQLQKIAIYIVTFLKIVDFYLKQNG